MQHRTRPASFDGCCDDPTVSTGAGPDLKLSVETRLRRLDGSIFDAELTAWFSAISGVHFFDIGGVVNPANVEVVSPETDF